MVIHDGTVMLSKLMQPKKAESPIYVTLEVSISVTSNVHALNAVLPMDVTPAGILRLPAGAVLNPVIIISPDVLEKLNYRVSRLLIK